jgi:hypothetical protein
MPVIINGTTGISGTDGSAATPAVQGTDAHTGMFFPAADQIAFAEGGTEVMRIDASGNVGIGTSSPTRRLTVGGASRLDGNVESAASPFVYSWQGGTSGQVRSGLLLDGTGQTLQFYTGSDERARITAAGLFQFNSGYGSIATAFGCRAWVNFNGFTAAIRASGNVSSVTYSGTGTYDINFSVAMPDVNYAGVGSNGTDQPAGLLEVSSTNKSVNTQRVYSKNATNNNLVDQGLISVAIFR